MALDLATALPDGTASSISAALAAAALGALVMVRAAGFLAAGRLVEPGSEARGSSQTRLVPPLPWQLVSLSLGHQESPRCFFPYDTYSKSNQ